MAAEVGTGLAHLLPVNFRQRDGGFTILELLIVLTVLGVVMAMALPSMASSMSAFRLKGDAQAVNNLVSLAKMRAAARFTRARVRLNLPQNQYFLETWDRANDTWVRRDGVNATQSGVTFGFGGLATPPPATQPEIAMSAECADDDGALIADTACLTFNSRGVPVDGGGAPTGQNAFYLTDGTGVYAITVTATPLVRFWWSPASSSQWTER